MKDYPILMKFKDLKEILKGLKIDQMFCDIR